MNNEIKEIINYFIKYANIEDSIKISKLEDYITNLQQENEIRQQDINNLTYQLAKMKEENERLNNCIDDQERVINSLIDKRDLYKINYNDYKSRCEKAIEELKSWQLDCNYSKENEIYQYIINILQNGSEENE